MIFTGVNNVLILVLKTGKKVTFSFPVDTNEFESYDKALIMDKIPRDFVEKYFWVPSTPYPPAYIERTLNVETGELNPLAESIEKKLDLIRRYRNTILKKLDLEMIKMLEEEDCTDCKRHLTRLKRYLREVPDLFSEVDFEDAQEVFNFDVFDNVFYVVVTNPGSGYTSLPTVTIEAPNNHPMYNGFQMEAVAIMEDEKISDIETTRVGSSYIMAPAVTISPPDQEGGEQAEAVASLPENNMDIPPRIIQMIEENDMLSLIAEKQV